LKREEAGRREKEERIGWGRKEERAEKEVEEWLPLVPAENELASSLAAVC